MSVCLENVRVEAKNGDAIIQNINLDIPKGSIQIIIGPSGAGKSTLLKVLNGLVTPALGRVVILGKDFQNGTRSKLRKEIGYIPQHLGLVCSYSVVENVLMGALSRTSTIRSFFKLFSKEDQALAVHLLEVVGLEDKLYKRVCCLSGGEKRRVAIARAFMQKPKILLADEILSDLDFVKIETITDELKKLQKEFGVTIVMVEHDIKVVRQFGEKIMIIKDGWSKGDFSTQQIDDTTLQHYFTAA